MFPTSLPSEYRNRVSQQPSWDAQFAEKMEVVEWLLTAVCQTFGFPLDSRFQFAPTDCLIEIYRLRYPRPGWKFWRLGDSLELETLSLEIENHLGCSDPELIKLELGQIVRRAESDTADTERD